jgi:hypothetical protein
VAGEAVAAVDLAGGDEDDGDTTLPFSSPFLFE